MTRSLRFFRQLARLLLGALWLLVSWPALGNAMAGFRLGVINERPDKPDHALSQYGRLHAYLQAKLALDGIRVDDLVIARDVNEMANRVAEGQVDAVIEGVMPTLSIKRRTNELVPTLVAWRKGQRQYHSVFFVRKADPASTLKDLAGKTIVFESTRSTSAYYVPKAALLAEGLTLASAETTETDPDVVRYLFAGSELNQAYWVHRGRADVGAFNNGDWGGVPEGIRKDLRIIHATRPLLRWVFSFTPHFNSRTRDKVVDVLVSAHRDDVGREALQAASRIAKFELLTGADEEGLAHWSQVLADLE